MSFAFLTMLVVLNQSPLTESDSLGFGILLTDAGQLHEGKIDRLGDLFRVSSGGQTQIVRAINVSFQGWNKTEAYDFLKNKKKTGLSSDAAKLANWCLKYGLRKEALIEAKIAAKLAPEDLAMAKLLVDCEEQAKKQDNVLHIVGQGTPNKPASPTAANTNSTTNSTAKPIPAATLPNMKTAKLTLPVDHETQELESLFGKHIQPVLMNLCINCHADVSRSGTYQLTRLVEGVVVSPKTKENFEASLLQIDMNTPANSKLLKFVTTSHGGKNTPTLLLTSIAYKNFESWVGMAAALAKKNQAKILTANAATAKFSTASPDATHFAQGKTNPTMQSPPANAQAIAEAQPVVQAAAVLGAQQPQAVPQSQAVPQAQAVPQPQAQPSPGVDPFDPKEFNKK